MEVKAVGVLGGGQLGRMLAQEAFLLSIPLFVLDPAPSPPASHVLPAGHHVQAPFTSPDAIRDLARRVDVLTVEIEHVDASALQAVLDAGLRGPAGLPLEVHPAPNTIALIQDKLRQKEHLRTHRCSVGDFAPVDSTPEAVRLAVERLGLPLMLKSRTLAYDGRGNHVLRADDDQSVQEALHALGDRPLYAERWVPFVKELAVMVVRTRDGDLRAFPTVETVHKDNVCHLVFAPLRASPAAADRARRVALEAVRTLDGAGVYGVEMFLLPDGDILINEIAPRPHNSGHYTIEACPLSQYGAHLRAILDLPIPIFPLLPNFASDQESERKSIPLIHPALSVAMLNVLGASSSVDDLAPLLRAALHAPGARVHMYGKAEARKGRKLGHITVTAASDAELRSRIRYLLAVLPRTNAETEDESERWCGARADAARWGGGEEGLAQTDGPRDGKLSHPRPLVSVVMGSDSDLPVMRPAASVLDQFAIPYELTIVSAHRTPERMVAFAKDAASRGVRCIIAGAGGAAHLPGMIAALTALPVVGVPVKGSSLDGVDSLHSIVQMPRGVPVATVAINGGMNAGLLAVRILSAGDPRLVRAMEAYQEKMESEVMTKISKLEQVGWEAYEVKK